MRTPVEFSVPPYGAAVVDTGVHIELAAGTVGMIMKLVPHVMRKYFRVYIERGYEDDIMGCGYLGLVKAADTWDASKGVKFSTYACKCIWRQITIDFFRLYEPSVHVPQHIRDRVLSQEGREALADFNNQFIPVSLNQAIKDSDDSDEFGDILPSNEESVEDQVICNLTVEETLDRMSKRQQEVMRYRLANMECTFAEIAEKIGVTKERVRQVNLVFCGAYKRGHSYYEACNRANM